MRLRPNRLLLGGIAAAILVKAATLTDGVPGPPTFEIGPLVGIAAIAATSAEDAGEDPDIAPPEQAAATCEMPAEALDAVREERALLDAQREAIATRRADLELAREKLLVEGERLSRLRDELAGFLGRVEDTQSADLDRLVALYRGMKPKEAAAIMDEIDMEVLIAVMGGMAARDAAPIMAQLEPDRARAISRLILERAKLPGDRDVEGIVLR